MATEDLLILAEPREAMAWVGVDGSGGERRSEAVGCGGARGRRWWRVRERWLVVAGARWRRRREGAMRGNGFYVRGARGKGKKG